jgi:hypothetical protein
MAFSQASGSQPAPFYYAMLFDGFFCILATAGMKATIVSQPRAQQQTVELDKRQYQGLHGFHW